MSTAQYTVEPERGYLITDYNILSEEVCRTEDGRRDLRSYSERVSKVGYNYRSVEIGCTGPARRDDLNERGDGPFLPALWAVKPALAGPDSGQYRLSSVVRPPGAFRASMKCQEPMAVSWRVRRCLTPTKAFAPLLAHFP